MPTPPGSNKPAGLPEDTASNSVVVKPPRGSGGNTSLNSCGGTGGLRPEELSKMFPTPPSLEHNPIASPCGHLSDGTPGELSDGSMIVTIARYKQEIYPNMGSPQEENIEDWSFVFRPPAMCKFVGSSKYAPLTNLPSQSLPPVTLPSHCVYKPSWQTQYQHQQQQQQQQQSVEKSSSQQNLVPPGSGTNSRPNSVASNHHSSAVMPPHPHLPHPAIHHPVLPAHPHSRAGLSPISPAAHFPPSPMTLAAMGGSGLPIHLQQQFRSGGPGSVGGVRTPCPAPPPYELPSPATSTASSYLNKNLNSVEPAPTPVMARAPEGNSLVVNILLGDTALNIFRDHNFDSCTLCVCNAGPKVVGNIRGADAGIYLPTPQPQPVLPFPPTSPFPGMGMNGPAPPYMMGSSPGHHGVAPNVMAVVTEEDPIRCSCGFSAVVNRRLSHRSGLFFEDELEITGIAEDPSDRRKGSLLAYLLPNTSKSGQENLTTGDILDLVPQNVMELLKEQCVIIQSSSSSLYRASRQFRGNLGPDVPYGTTVNVLEFMDGNDVTHMALEQGRQALLESTTVAMCKVEEMQQRQQQIMQHGGRSSSTPCVHRWPYLRAMGPQCNQDIVWVMKSLRPLLQEVIHKKCTTRLWDAPYTVKGPLTWRQFHRLAGRG